MTEINIDLELFAALLTHIRTLGVPGSILVFLPGWNVIFLLLRYLQEHPVFGKSVI